MNLEQPSFGPEANKNLSPNNVLPEVDLGLLKTNERQNGLVSQETNTARQEVGGESNSISLGAVSGLASSITDPRLVDSTTRPTAINPVPNAPVSADDGDQIERDWIDTTKQIIASTAGDPHTREERLKDLQNDYLFKRYGRQPGDSNNDSKLS